MKYCLFISILFFVQAIGAAPQLHGYHFTPLLTFDKDVRAKAAGNYFYTAEKLSDDRISIKKYTAKCERVSAVEIDLIQAQKYYNRFKIVDFEVGSNGQVVIIGQGSDTENCKKQKCYLIHYIPGSQPLTMEIKDQSYLYIDLLVENDKFYFCTAQWETKFNCYDGNFSLVRKSFMYNPVSKKLTSEIINDNKHDTIHNVNNLLISYNWYHYGNRDLVTKRTVNAPSIDAGVDEITISQNDFSLNYERRAINQIYIYDLKPFEDWIVAFNHRDDNYEYSSIIFPGRRLLTFDHGELFQDIVMDPESQIPSIITSKGVYSIQITFERTLELAENKMLSAYNNWQKRSELELEEEHLYRISTQTEWFKDSILNVEVNKIWPLSTISVYKDASYQEQFNALRIKLEEPNEYFYTTGWNRNQVFANPKLTNLIVKYKYGTEIVGFDYTVGDNTYGARLFLPPEIIGNSVSESTSDPLEKVFRIDFKSKAANHDVQFLINDKLVHSSTIELENDLFQVVAKVAFQEYKVHAKLNIASELGTKHYEEDLYCKEFLDAKEEDCFIAYHNDLIGGFSKPTDLIEAMNVCIIVANSNFTQSDTTKEVEIPLLENSFHADTLKNLLIEEYHYNPDQVIILRDLEMVDMQNLFLELENVGNSNHYASQAGATKINLMLVILSHGSEDNRLITSDCKYYDIASAILNLNNKKEFKNYVQDFLYIEDICYGSFTNRVEAKTIGAYVDLNSKENFCRYATNGSWIGIMSSWEANDNGKVVGSNFIKGFNQSLEQNKNKECVRLEDVIGTMFKNEDLKGIPLFLNLKSDSIARPMQKSFYFYNDSYLQSKDKLYEN